MSSSSQAHLKIWKINLNKKKVKFLFIASVDVFKIYRFMKMLKSLSMTLYYNI